MGEKLASAITLWTLRLALAGIFIYAGTAKLLDPQIFLFAVRTFDLLPDPWAAWFAMTLPWLEILAGIALLTPWACLGGATVIAGLLVGFIAALTSAMMRQLEVSCGCFGSGDLATSFLEVIALRIVFLIMAVSCLWMLWASRSNRALS